MKLRTQNNSKLKSMRLSGRVLLLILILPLLSACHPREPKVQHISLTAVKRIWKQQTDALVAQLQKRGVKVVRVGETVTIIMPSDRLFNPRSANFKPKYISTLDTVLALMQKYGLVAVNISGYTDSFGPARRNKVLSERQAQVVENYLWTHGIDARLLLTRGYGEKYPTAANISPEERSMNRRVVIKFRYTHWII